MARLLVAGEVLAAVLEHQLRIKPCAGNLDHERRYRLAPLLVRHADHGCLGDTGETGDHLLDFGGIDILAPALDHVLQAARDPEETFVVAPSEIAGTPPAVAPVRSSQVRAIPIALAHERT